MTTFEQVSAGLEKAGIGSVWLASGSEGAVMAIPTYGRVVGLWSDRSADNHLWVNAEFLERGEAKSSGRVAAWANPGGDRVWLSPEREFFIRDLARPWETYSVPACMDPGNYSYKLSGRGILMENSGVAEAFASALGVSFTISRHIRPLAHDLIEDFARGTCLKGAGYVEESVIEVDRCCPIKVGLWNLVQVPLGGNASVPVKHLDCHTAFFGEPEEAVCYGGDGMKVSFGRQEMFKIGVKASSILGKVAYILKHEDGSASLLLRRFGVGRDVDYADTPWNAPDDAGYALQLFCGAAKHGFGELEHHAPAVGGTSGRTRYVGKSVLCAFSGHRERCEELSRLFLKDSKSRRAED